ncbi:hypothetical protein [Deinococcus roseus]|uniref:Polyketide cyclase n=1 Tax=Deinococcus roseus TaxID=392414 RepID=A0ABQ2CWX4_9DEIO|nr:hypothetical protein [Deinococcus roseus]GGJ22037.1 hypothetical protein GCM10008938_05410 [Deinococcus roseus]
MHICAFSTSTATTPQAVWQLWTQPRHWPSWDKTLKQAELSGPFKQGVSGILTFQDGSTAPFTVVMCQMLQSYVLSVPLGLGVDLLIKRELWQEGEKVHFRQEVSLMGPAMAKLLHGVRKKALQLETFKAMEGLLERLRGEMSALKDNPQGDVQRSAP